MKIAILADIHGNAKALEAVLNDAKKQKVKKIFVLGDLIGYYYGAKEVLSLLHKWDKEVIQGNHERMLEIAIKDKVFARKYQKKYGSALKIAVKELNQKEIKFLLQLPPSKRVRVGRVSFDLYHGSPWDEDTYLYPDSAVRNFKKALETEANFVLVGHSHYQFGYSQNGKHLINPGSVGQSRLEGGIADWSIIETLDKSFEMMKTKFDIGKIAAKAKSLDPEVPYLWQVLRRRK